MKKICSIVCLCIAIALSSCGGADSQIKDYEKAMQENNFEKASEILSGLDAKKLTVAQKKQIREIHEEYYSKAVDAYLDDIEKKIDKGEVEEALAMLEGVDLTTFTDKQIERVNEFKGNRDKNGMNEAGRAFEEAEEVIGAADNAMRDAANLYGTGRDIIESAENMYDDVINDAFDEAFDYSPF